MTDYQLRAERAFVEGELDPFDYDLAERLHMTVERMRNEMSNKEYLEWRALANYRAAQREVEDRMAEQQRRVGR